MCEWTGSTCGISSAMDQMLSALVRFMAAPDDSMCTEADMFALFTARDNADEAIFQVSDGCGGCILRNSPDEDPGECSDAEESAPDLPSREEVAAVCPDQVAACEASVACLAEMNAALSDPNFDPEATTQTNEMEDIVYCVGLEELRADPELALCIPRPPAPPPPPPVVVVVEIVTYNAEETTAAAGELAAALVVPAPAPAPAGAPPPPPPPVVEIAATVGFAVDIATIAEGSDERATFEADFKTSMAGSIGGGSAVSADKIIVDEISANRRRLLDSRRMQSDNVNVDFHIVAPASVQTQAASLVAAVDTSAISVGGATASAISAPVVTAPPDIDCVGAWDTCSASCDNKFYRVTTVASGSGTACAAEHYDTSACTAGDGECPVVNCVGEWSACGSDCDDKTYTVSVAADGGTACAAADGATGTCAPGEGACPAPVPTPVATSPPPSTSAAGASTSVTVMYMVGAMTAAVMLL